MSNVKVKICGLTRAQDVDAAVEAGADMLGFVFAPSPRQLNLDSAVKLIKEVPPAVTRVGLFMNAGVEQVNEILESLPLDLLQFHGAEDSCFCASFGMPYIKAIAMGDAGGPLDAASLYPDAAGLLYDSHQSGKAGGTSRTFDWSLLDNQADRIWLAGGLKPDNVADAIRTVRPWVVDVSSGVETAPGIKSYQLMQDFVRAAKSVDIR